MGAGHRHNDRSKMDEKSLYEEGNALYKQGKCEEACAKFEAAAEQGYAPAQYQLGSCYENGAGVAQDLSQAVCWYKKAAEQGHEDAQLKLSACFRNGVGVEQDLEEAEYWENASDKGD